VDLACIVGDVRRHEHAILLVPRFEQLLIGRTEDAAIPKVVRVDSVRDQRNRSDRR